MNEIIDDESQNMYLTFDTAGETYAVNICCVTSIVGMQRISEIPDVPAFIKGAMNLRGKVIPIMDLRLRFGLPWQAYDDRTTIIVLEVNDTSTGLIVDKVNDVLAIPPEKIGPPPHWTNNTEKGIVRGLGRMENQVCIILDVVRLLLNEETTIDIPMDGIPCTPEAA